ncbi:TetR family transcriptional regulator [Ktedonobacter sp. SOSP1-85]|uniref:TetR/AcrR family transcriptional regulator n=1 Tax=unclassified Ktedonobacter TaxID=388461 RepID=UPI0019155804|nr:MULTISPECIES: TetR/AcrR family transcriptional regulator [unclassified Ktedonobacter]GHO79524.1 TetR family transcriptional regulator [Ktedonobacter sp. SOSP1-85]
MSPREKRRARTRETILEAAMQIVMQHGVDALSMREIAERIDYSPSGLYEYFSSKEEIIAELVNEGFERLTARMEHGTQGATALSRLQEAGKVYMHFALQEPQLYLMMFNHRPLSPFPFTEVEQNTAYSQLVQILQDGLLSGEFRSASGAGWQELAYASWSLMHGLAMLRLTLMSQVTEDIDRLHERAFQAFVAQLK